MLRYLYGSGKRWGGGIKGKKGEEEKGECILGPNRELMRSGNEVVVGNYLCPN